MKTFDIIVIGAGPSGISASIYAKRLNYNINIIKKNNGILENIGFIENYYGFSNPISGKELAFNGLNQVKRLGCNITSDEVIEIQKIKSDFMIKTIKNIYYSKSLILAMGIKKNTLKIKNLDNFLGKGVSYCAICDGYFFKNKEIAVIGSGNYAINEINILKKIVNKIYVIDIDNNSIIKSNDDKIIIIKKKIKEIFGKDSVEKIIFDDNSNLIIDGIFVAYGHMSSNDLAMKLGIEMTSNNKNILVNKNMQTNIDGIFAVGDCTGAPYQISKAVYEGMISAFSINEYLKNKLIENSK